MKKWIGPVPKWHENSRALFEKARPSAADSTKLEIFDYFELLGTGIRSQAQSAPNSLTRRSNSAPVKNWTPRPAISINL
jgi:hypothetical protein